MSITKSQRKKLVPNSFLYQRIISWVDIIYNQGVPSTSRPGSGDHTSCCCRHTFLLRFDFSANRYTHPLLTSPCHQMGSWGLAERDPCCLYPSPARRHTTYSVAAELSQQSHHLCWANGCFSASNKVCDHHVRFFTTCIAPSSIYYCLLFLRRILPVKAPWWPRTSSILWIRVLPNMELSKWRKSYLLKLLLHRSVTWLKQNLEKIHFGCKIGTEEIFTYLIKIYL